MNKKIKFPKQNRKRVSKKDGDQKKTMGSETSRNSRESFLNINKRQSTALSNLKNYPETSPDMLGEDCPIDN